MIRLFSNVELEHPLVRKGCKADAPERSLCESAEVRVDRIFTRQHTPKDLNMRLETVCDTCRQRFRVDIGVDWAVRAWSKIR